MTDFLSLMRQTLSAMPMITSSTMVVTALMTSFYHSKILPRRFFNGFLITKWKEILINVIFFRATVTKWIKIGGSFIKNRTSEKIPDVKIDSKLSFEEHFRNICKKASSKLRSFGRATPYMDIKSENSYRMRFSILSLLIEV